MIQALFQHGWTVAVMKWIAMGKNFFDGPSMRVAPGARIYLGGFTVVGTASLWTKCFRVDDPGSRFGLAEPDLKPHVASVPCSLQLVGLFRPGNMI